MSEYITPMRQGHGEPLFAAEILPAEKQKQGQPNPGSPLRISFLTIKLYK